MSIQWFPGHMHAAQLKAAEAMRGTDLVIEVVDARIPGASCNPMIHALRLHRARPCLKILNKSDLADSRVTAQWLTHYNQEKGVTAIALDCKAPKQVGNIIPLCKTLAPHRAQPAKPLRIMIMGIPNVGKSTLMNALLKKRVAAVGNEPAITKTQQRLYLDKHVVLVDTPGMLWPKIQYEGDGLMLAASHAMGVNAYLEEDTALFLADCLLERYPSLLAARYGSSVALCDGVSLLEAIAKKRAFALKKGELDIEKAAHTLLQDYRTGALGRISLESPASRLHMLACAANQVGCEETLLSVDYHEKKQEDR